MKPKSLQISVSKFFWSAFKIQHKAGPLICWQAKADCRQAVGRLHTTRKMVLTLCLTKGLRAASIGMLAITFGFDYPCDHQISHGCVESQNLQNVWKRAILDFQSFHSLKATPNRLSFVRGLR